MKYTVSVSTKINVKDIQEQINSHTYQAKVKPILNEAEFAKAFSKMGISVDATVNDKSINNLKNEISNISKFSNIKISPTIDSENVNKFTESINKSAFDISKGITTNTQTLTNGMDKTISKMEKVNALGNVFKKTITESTKQQFKGFLDTDTFNESVKGLKEVNIQVKELGESKIIDGTMFRNLKTQTSDYFDTENNKVIHATKYLNEEGEVIKVISAETKSLSKVSANIPTIQTGSAEDLTKYIDSVKSLQELSRTTSSVPTANINGETFSDLSKQVAKYRDELGQVTTATEYYNKEGNLVAVNNESLKKSFTETGTVMDRIGEAVVRYITYTVFLQAFNVAVVKSIDTLHDYDDALTEFKKVSDLGGLALKDYAENLGKVGTALGKTRTEMVQASTEFIKSGYSESDSAVLAKISELYTNIADSEVSASDSASMIISQMKAFNISAQNAEHIINAINEVSNQTAVSSTDLSESLNISAAGLSALGNSYDETIGLITAGTEIMQGKAMQVSRGLITAGNNIAAFSKQADKMTISVNGVSKSIDYYDSQTGDLRNTYEIFEDISQYWDDMTSAERTNLAVTLGGKTRFSVVSATLSNFAAAQKAVTLATNSANSAEKENAKYMESLTAKYNNFKAQAQELIIGNGGLSNLLKMFTDLGTQILKLANTPIGSFVTDLVAIGVALSTIYHVAKLLKLEAITSHMQGSIELIKSLILSLKSLILQIRGVATAEKAATAASDAFNVSSKAGNWVTLILTLFATIGSAVYMLVKSKQEVKKSISDLGDEYTKLKEEATSAESSLSDINNQINKINSNKMSLVDDDELTKLKSAKTYYEELSKVKNAEAESQLEKTQNSFKEKYFGTTGDITSETSSIQKTLDSTLPIIKASEDNNEFSYQTEQAYDTLNSLSDNSYAKTLATLRGYQEDVSALQDMEKSGDITSSKYLETKKEADKLENDLQNYISQVDDDITSAQFDTSSDVVSVLTNTILSPFNKAYETKTHAYDTSSQKETKSSLDDLTNQVTNEADITSFQEAFTDLQATIGATDDEMLKFLGIASFTSIDDTNITDLTSNLTALSTSLADTGKSVSEMASKLGMSDAELMKQMGYTEILPSNYDKINTSIEEYNSALSNLEETTGKSEKEIISMSETLGISIIKYNELITKGQELATQFQTVNTTIDDLQTGYQTLSDAVAEYNSNGKISIDTLQSVLALSSEQLLMMNGTLDKISDQSDKLKTLKNALGEVRKQQVINEYEQKRLNLENEKETKILALKTQANLYSYKAMQMMSKGASYSDIENEVSRNNNAIASQINEITKEYGSQAGALVGEQQKIISTIDKLVAVTDDSTESLKKSDDATKDYSDSVDDTSDSVADLTDNVSALTDALDAYIDKLQAEKDAQDDVTESAKNAIDAYKERLKARDEVLQNRLTQEKKDYDRLEATDEYRQMEIYRTANEQNLKLARERLAIDKQKLADLEAEKQAREDNKTIEEDMLNLAKAQATKVVVMTDNGFQSVAEEDEVAKSTASLTNDKSDIEFNNYYSKTKDSLDTAISTDEDVVEGYEKIDDTLEEFFDKYTLTSTDLVDGMDKLIDSLESTSRDATNNETLMTDISYSGITNALLKQALSYDKEKAEYNPETNTYTVDQTTQNATQQKIVGYGKKEYTEYTTNESALAQQEEQEQTASEEDITSTLGSDAWKTESPREVFSQLTKAEETSQKKSDEIQKKIDIANTNLEAIKNATANLSDLENNSLGTALSNKFGSDWEDNLKRGKLSSSKVASYVSGYSSYMNTALTKKFGENWEDNVVDGTTLTAKQKKAGKILSSDVTDYIVSNLDNVKSASSTSTKSSAKTSKTTKIGDAVNTLGKVKATKIGTAISTLGNLKSSSSTAKKTTGTNVSTKAINTTTTNSGTTINISNISLPQVTDAKSFLSTLTGMVKSKSSQTTYSNR